MNNNNQPVKKNRTMLEILEANKDKISKALARHPSLTADKMLRVVSTEFRKTPKLWDCKPENVLGAVIQSASIGLEPGGVLGHCYLVPYYNKHNRQYECQFLLGYRGMIKLAQRSGEVASIEARAVFEQDTFEISYGTDAYIRHVPTLDGDSGNMKGVYALVKLTNGGHYMEWLPISKIEEIRLRSKAQDSGPWQTDYEEMAKKTAIRRLFKFLPIGDVEQGGVKKEELTEFGIDSGIEDSIPGEVIDMNTGELIQQSQPDAAQPQTPAVISADDLNNRL